jgi:protein disulfide-isomerase A6
VNYGLEKATSEVKKRMKGGKTDDSKSKKEEKKSKEGPASDKDVIVLDSNNFDELVLGSKDIWMVEFYAPWCGHCKKLEPEWNEAASKLKGSVKLGKVDATVESSLAQRF